MRRSTPRSARANRAPASSDSGTTPNGAASPPEHPSSTTRRVGATHASGRLYANGALNNSRGQRLSSRRSTRRSWSTPSASRRRWRSATRRSGAKTTPTRSCRATGSAAGSPSTTCRRRRRSCSAATSGTRPSSASRSSPTSGSTSFTRARRAASRGSRRPTASTTACRSTSAPAAASRARTSSSAAAGRDRRAALAAARARGGDPDGAPSLVDDLVTLLGGDATVPLLKVLRRLSVDKGDDRRAARAAPRADVGGERRRQHLHVLKLLEAHGMGICLDRVGASPLLDQPLLPAIEAAARRWVTHELQKPNGGASGCAAPKSRRSHFRRRRRRGGGGAGAAAAGGARMGVVLFGL